MSRSPRAERFYRVRVGILLTILAGVLLYALHDVQRRNERKDWDHTVDVAVVMLRMGAVDPAAIAILRSRLPELDARLAEEMRRYRPGARLHPFAFTMFGPVDVTAPPPTPAGDSWSDLARQSYDSWSYLRPIDAAANLDASTYDARIYVVLRPPKSKTSTMVEGASEEGGRVGTVEVELDSTMSDFALFVVAHELFHTLGATDKYDAAGRAMVPDGLVEPTRVPLYPQRFAELMARNRPLSATAEAVPASLAELGVGATTAKEIGWAR